MKKILVLLAATAMFLTPMTGQVRQRVSILGDSYSTFSGYIPAEYEQWYTGDTKMTDVTDVRQTWWWQVVNDGGYLLEKNDSYSGATISYHGYHDADYSDRSFITRLTRLGSPDILLIFGATNDSWAGAAVGSYKYEGQTREDLFTFRPAMAKLLSEAQSRFPNARIIFLINTGLRKEITESIIEICKHYGVEYLQLKDIGKQSGHPNIAGMKAIASQVLEVLQPQQASYPQGQLPYRNPYAFGHDLSFVLQAERRGTTYFDIDGTQKSPWQIFRDHGFNWGRLMICNEPSRLGQDLAYVKEGALKLKEHGYHFALDFMMADGWSNPMTQPTPSSMENMTHEQRVKAFHDYVHHVISSLKAQGTTPEIVQVGNEISNGAFWPTGRIFYGEEKKARSQWKEFTDYLKAGCSAIREVDPAVQIMLHLDFGGDLEMSDIFFGKMIEYGVDYDVIGFSFYPWSHGTLMDLRDNLYYTIRKYGKPIYVIETGYYSEPSQYFERKGVKGPYPETPEGQKQWLQAVNEIVMAAPDNLGRGVFWWEPMFRGRGFFDDKTRVAKPIVEAFEHYAFPADRPDGNPRIWDFEGDERP